jgi:hypothetical protein
MTTFETIGGALSKDYCHTAVTRASLLGMASAKAVAVQVHSVRLLIAGNGLLGHEGETRHFFFWLGFGSDELNA